MLLTTHPPSSAAIMEEESYTSTHPLGHTGSVTGNLYLYLLPLMDIQVVGYGGLCEQFVT